MDVQAVVPMSLTFEVIGLPAPQGSKRAFLPPGGTRPVVVDDNPARLRDWRTAMRDTAAGAMGEITAPYYSGPVAVRLTFRMPRPASVKRDYPAVAPDLDKLVRAALDAFTQAGLWEDDARVVQIMASKVYAPRGGLLVDLRPVR